MIKECEYINNDDDYNVNIFQKHTQKSTEQNMRNTSSTSKYENNLKPSVYIYIYIYGTKKKQTNFLCKNSKKKLNKLGEKIINKTFF